VKSPNPNDPKTIKLGELELEADTLLNGRIHIDKFKQQPAGRDLSPKEKKALKATQLNKQKKAKRLAIHEKKEFAI